MRVELIENAELVTGIFGRWPSFHDAEVVRVTLDRSGPDGPTLEAQIHVFGLSGEVDPKGHYVLENHTLVTLQFRGVVLDRLEDFNHQNVLGELEMTALDPSENDGCRIAVQMHSSFGLEGSFRCQRCAVASVRPFDPPPRLSGT